MDYRDDSVSFLCGLATGLALGVLGMFIFDPKEGRRRRTLARDKIVRYGNEAADYATGTAKDLRNRAQGMAAEARSAMQETPDAKRL
jgi:gas vesicle protein